MEGSGDGGNVGGKERMGEGKAVSRKERLKGSDVGKKRRKGGSKEGGDG